MPDLPDTAGRGPASSFEAEAAAFLQGRLRIVAAVLAIGILGLFAVVRVLGVVFSGGDFSQLAPADPFAWVHLGSGLLAGLAWIRLRRAGRSARDLRIVDAVVLYVSLAAAVVLLLLGGWMTAPFVLGALSLLVVARAVVVPSSGRRSFWLSLPAAPAVFAVLATRPAPLAPPDGNLVADAIMYAVIVLLAVGLAALASHVNFTLRRQVYEAMKVGPYEFVEKVGEGAMGEVWRANHALLKRPTAIKLLRPEITGADTLKRFEREVMMTSRLTHPNTVSIYDYGRTADGVFYYAMELLDGADLDRIVKETGPLPPERAVHVLDQVCGALEEAHSLGLIHRDIKPGNIQLCRRGLDLDVVKVLDFGLVKETGGTDPSLTQSGAFVGTPATGAPERFFGDGVGPASDLYSLGVTAFYILTGSWPFVGKSVVDTVRMHMYDAPAPPSSVRAGIPPEIDAIVLNLLAKRPEDRPPGAAAVRERLRRAPSAGRWTQEDARRWWKSVPLGSGTCGISPPGDREGE